MVVKSKRINFGVIGAGGIALCKTIPGLLKVRKRRLVAITDPVGVKDIAPRFGGVRAYTREADLLADPEVQAVYIASPVRFHAEQIERATAAGKHT